MSSDNFDFEAWDGTIYPNLCASTYSGIPLSKRLVEFMGEKPGPSSDYTEYGIRSEDLSSDARPQVSLIDDLLDEIERLRSGLGTFAEYVRRVRGTGDWEGERFYIEVEWAENQARAAGPSAAQENPHG